MCHCLPASAPDAASPALRLDAFDPDAGHAYFDMTPAQVAARVSSLTVAATLVADGGALADKRLAADITVNLLDTAAWLARQLAGYLDANEISPTKGA